MFKRFQMLKKGVETIKKVAPSVGSALGKKKVDLLKKMGKTQRTNPENFKKAGGDKLKKEILAAETRVKKAEGGSMNAKNGMSSQVSKTILKGVADGVYSMDDFKKYKKTGEIPGSKKRTKKAIGGMLGFKKKDKKKEKEKKDSEKGTKPKDLIYKPKKMKRLEELRKELKKDGGPIGAAGQEALPRKPQYITKKEKPQYITKKSKYITKKKKPVEGESKYITRKEKPKYITRKQKDLGRQMGGGPRD